MGNSSLFAVSSITSLYLEILLSLFGCFLISTAVILLSNKKKSDFSCAFSCQISLFSRDMFEKKKEDIGRSMQELWCSKEISV
jgi:hypothetical protein